MIFQAGRRTAKNGEKCTFRFEKLYKSFSRLYKEQFSFNKGWLQLRQGDIAACRKELMVVFNVTTRAAFLQRLKGNVIPNVLEAHNVEKVFAKYGIKDVWGA